jgi:hypothetical protein
MEKITRKFIITYTSKYYKPTAQDITNMLIEQNLDELAIFNVIEVKDDKNNN